MRTDTTKDWQRLYGDIDSEPEKFYEWMLWKLKQEKLSPKYTSSWKDIIEINLEGK